MNRQRRLDLPEYWDEKDDQLSQYLAMAQRKVLTTYDEERQYYDLLRRVNDEYARLSWAMYERPEKLAPMFVSRSHAAFMSAVNVALTGALPETYMILRGALEAAFYGYLCVADPTVEEAWTKRNESEAFLRACKRAFRPHDILARLTASDQRAGQQASDLYELTIDHGGHPNALAIVPHLHEVENADGTGGASTLDFLTASRRKRRPCYIHCARVGLCCLTIFGLTFPDIYAADGGTMPANIAALYGEVDQHESDLSKPNNGLEDVYLQLQREELIRQRINTAGGAFETGQR